MEGTEDTSSPQTNNDKQLVYLNFKGRVPKEILQKKVFLKAANLDKENPLVQVNDLLFKGSHDYAIGTNLFFRQQDTSTPSPLQPFEKSFPIDLNFLGAATKVINCEQVKLKPKKTVLPEGSEDIIFNLDWNYDELLKKFETGNLDIKDMVLTHAELEEIRSQANEVKKEPDESRLNSQETEEMEVDEEANSHNDMEVLEQIPEVQMLQTGYTKLLNLAKKPMGTKIDQEFKAVPCDKSCTKNLEYKNIECKILEPPYFSVSKNLHMDLSEDFLCNFIDLERCKLFGLLPSTEDFSRPLAEEEKKVLLRLENLDLLSLQARYIVIQTQIEKLENFIQNVSEQVLRNVDKFEHTAEETLELYRKLRQALEKRINEIRTANETDTWHKQIQVQVLSDYHKSELK